MRKVLLVIAVIAIALTACNTEANTASRNVSLAADQFEIDRRIVFMNGITDTYMLVIEGRCSIEADTMDGQLEVICKIADEGYKKHFLGLSDNVTYFVEQLEVADVDAFHYRVIFRPETLIPDIDVATSP